jgi:hypothetical protein
MIRPCIPTRLNQGFGIPIVLPILILAVAWPSTGVGAADLDGNANKELVQRA